MIKKLLLFSVIVPGVFHLAAQEKAQWATPVEINGIYSIRMKDVALEADPKTGGRVSALKIGDHHFLTGRDINATYWGSSFWPSPQNVWNSANLAELDNEPYTIAIESNSIKMISQKDKKSGFVFTKEISGNKNNNSFVIKYTITNQSDSARKVAPWEVTRVFPKGLTFFPKGEGERWGTMANFAEDKNGITWFNHGNNKIPAQHNKFFSDGAEGWVAQVNDGIILVKKFPDMGATETAPSEAEVEIYSNAAKSYVEIEQQGAYEELQPAGSLHWEVIWYIRKLPAHIKIEPGNPELVTYVRKLVEDQKK
ncbi:MAG TPA: hypothetical protein VFV68_13245 [Agriterribacter sp.]|nr:hypothetical protein [Agriterribacter sp.]